MYSPLSYSKLSSAFQHVFTNLNCFSLKHTVISFIFNFENYTNFLNLSDYLFNGELYFIFTVKLCMTFRCKLTLNSLQNQFQLQLQFKCLHSEVEMCRGQWKSGQSAPFVILMLSYLNRRPGNIFHPELHYPLSTILLPRVFSI